MRDFNKIKAARLGALIHNYRFLCRNCNVDDDFAKMCLDTMAWLSQANTVEKIDDICRDAYYYDKPITGFPLGNILDLPIPTELILKIRNIPKPSRLGFFLADTTKTQLFDEYGLTQEEFDLLESEANKIGYSFIDNEKYGNRNLAIGLWLPSKQLNNES